MELRFQPSEVLTQMMLCKLPWSGLLFTRNPWRSVDVVMIIVPSGTEFVFGSVAVAGAPGILLFRMSTVVNVAVTEIVEPLATSL